jgi:virginiamycin B lyase
VNLTAHRAKSPSRRTGFFALAAVMPPADGSGALSSRLHTRLAIALLTIAVIAIFAVPARAASPYHPELSALNVTGLSHNPCGAATDANGNRYVMEGGEGQRLVRVFGSKEIGPGEIDENTELTSFTASANVNLATCSIAVDAQGDVYVSGLALTASGAPGGDVVRYKPSSYPPVSGTTYAADTSLNTNGTLVPRSESAISVAVDPATQRPYVAHAAANEVQELTLSGMTDKVTTFTLGNLPAACTSTTTGPIIFRSTGAPMRTNINAALEAACSGGVNDDFLLAGNPPQVSFQGQFAGQDAPLLTCAPAAGSCSAATIVTAGPSYLSSYEADGTPVDAEMAKGLVPGANFTGVGVYGETGNVYAVDSAHNKAYVLSPDGTSIEAEIDGSDSEAGAFIGMVNATLAVDQFTGHMLVSDVPGHGVVDEFDEAGHFITEISRETPITQFAALPLPAAIAVDNGNASPHQGNVYVASSGDGALYAFGPLPGGKPRYLLVVSKAGAGSGTASSEPPGISCGSTCEAEFNEGKVVTLSAVPDVGSKFAGWAGCDSETGSPGEEECVVTLDTAKHLSARFDSRPLVSDQAATQITSSSAHLTAAVNPKGKATIYRFEYLTQAQWQQNGESFAGAAVAGTGKAGSGLSAVPVGVKVEGLQSGTAYRFRLVAENEVGKAEGERNGADQEIGRSFATYLPPQVFAGECPGNEALRGGPSASLPDCRAWEQSSPVDKNLSNVQGSAALVVASEAGDAITFESAAGIPGGSGSQEFPTYIARRGPGDWTTSGTLPNPSDGQRAKLAGWTPDLAFVLDEAERFGQGASLLQRATADGAERQVVPYTLPSPRYAYVGASRDGSTVVFEAQPSEKSNTTLKLTPGAAAGKPNVYAWDRDTGQLQLAGVLPDGSTPPQGSNATGAQDYVVDTHRVAADGSVFFTDRETGQLYERLNPTAEETKVVDKGSCVPDPVLACTVHVSASQKEDGKGPGGRDSAGPQAARFMAASPDGQTVTFLGSEKLTDDANTGPEPEGPAIARAKAGDGSAKDLEFRPAFARAISIDQAESYVYWSDPAHGRIGRAKLDGSVIEESFITGLTEPQGVAVIDEGAAKYLFWTEPRNGKAGEGTIGRADLDGGGLDVNCLTGLKNPRELALDASHVYWTSPGTSAGDVLSGNGNLGRADLACDQASVNAEFINEAGGGDVAVDAAHIYLSHRGAVVFAVGFIRRFNIDGSGSGIEAGFPIELTGIKSPPHLALDGAHVYWTNPTTAILGRSNLDGGEVNGSLVTAAGRPEDAAVSGEWLYWTANQGVQPNPGQDLYQLNRQSGKLVDLAPDSDRQNGAEVQGLLGTSADGSYVYFAANGVPDGTGNSPNAEGEEAAPGDCKDAGKLALGSCNLYVAHDGKVDFIARLGAGTDTSPTGHAFNWMTGQAEAGNSTEKQASVSADGQTLTFSAAARLTDYDNSAPTCNARVTFGAPLTCTEFYRFHYADSSLTCLSCDPTGAPPTGPARLRGIRAPVVGGDRVISQLSRNLSRDGSRFFFETPDALVAADTNGEDGCPPWGSGIQKGSATSCQDVYEWEAPGTGSCEEGASAYSAANGGCIYLISSGKSDEASFFGDAGASGDDVFVFTFERLVGQDRDALLDVYDASVGGGLPSQNPPETKLCDGEACKPLPAVPPPPQSAGSASFSGPDNLRPRRGHKKKKHRRKKHAAHRRHHGHGSEKRSAKHNRGSSR